MKTCASCGAENPAHARFCLACAAALDAPAAGEERKVVSVLFVDLVGFTAASEQADPEDVRATLRSYHARVKQEIERFGGTVEKFVGDAVMAVFGAPLAHEDDAERAVRAALRILEAVDELGLSVRGAVNTGEAVVALGARPAEGEGIVTGDVVNTASRLQDAAPVGGVVVGELTYRATSGIVEYEELPPVELKGKAEPVPLWRAMAARSRFGIDLEPARVTAFLGRDHELTLLREMFLRAERERSVQLVTVTGEPGVGKSRLVAELRAWLDERPELVRWRQGRCLSYGEGITYWALGEVVKAHAGILESDPAERAVEKVREVLPESQDREWLVARLAPLVGGEAGEAPRSESYTAWRRFLEEVASDRPLVLAIEDLHWADEPLVEFLEHLVDWGSDVPMLVLCSARPELYERHPGWGGGKRNSTTIGLSPLSADDTTRLVTSLLEQAVLPAETQAALLERGGGNPLYTVEFVRMLVDSGVLDDRGRLAAVEIAVPETVQALIAARLDTLAPERKALLHDAAVLGKVFWAGALAAMDGRGREEVDAGLRELVRKELVRPARVSSVEGDGEFSFWHASIRDVAYGQIPRDARARKHAAAASWLEEVTPDNVEVLAHHYDQALRLAEAAGAADLAAELRERARAAAYAAGDRVQHLDFAAAERYFDRALELAAADTPEWAWARLRSALTRFRQGSAPTETVEAAYREALAVFERDGDDAGRAAGRGMLSGLKWHLGDQAEAVRLSAEALEIRERLPPARELVFARANHAFQSLTAGELQLALEQADRAIALARELGLSDFGLKHALQTRGCARVALGDEGGLDDNREALRLALDDGTMPAIFYLNLGFSLWPLAGPTAAIRAQREGVEAFVRHGVDASHGRAETAWTLYELGEWDEVIATAEEVVTSERAHGRPGQPGVIAQAMRAHVLAWRGRADEAAAVVAELLPRARASVLQVRIPALAAAIVSAHARDDLAAAVAHVEELERAQSSHTTLFVGFGHLDAVRAAVAAGELDLAHGLVDGMKTATPREQHVEAACRAVLAEARGDLVEARRLYEDAAARWRAWPFVLEEALSLAGAARCGDDRAAAAGAAAIFDRLGVASELRPAAATG